MNSSKVAAAQVMEPLVVAGPPSGEPIPITHDPVLKDKFGLDNWGIPDSVRQHPYFVELNDEHRTMVAALRELDRRMRERGDYHLISGKSPHSLFGQPIEAGQVGIYAYKGRPVMTIRPGFYWNFSPTHTWSARRDLTAPIDSLGFTSAQVGQSGALVIEDPENRVFTVRNGGFAAFGAHGRFKVLAQVDTLNLGDGCAVYDSSGSRNQAGRLLGHLKEIRSNGVVVATFLNVPASNVAVVQQGDDLLLLGAGQHVITNPKTTFRKFYTLGERQVQIATKPSFTIEGVSVVLHVNLRYRVVDPLLLTRNYDDPFQALANPAQIAVNSVVSRLSYQQFMRAKSIGGDVPDVDVVPWIEAFKGECLRELRTQATTYGIVVESFDVLDRSLEGDLGKDLEKQAEQVLQNQIKATQLELSNHIAIETQKGQLEVTRVKTEQTKSEADAHFYAATKTADAKFYDAMKAAESSAKASELEAAQRAKNIIMLAEAKQREVQLMTAAYASVDNEHVKRMQLEDMEVQKRRELPAQTIYIAGESSSSSSSATSRQIAGSLAEGIGFSTGQAISASKRVQSQQ
ncbi:hypothetical protein RI367_006173 [Sorochytrium milnesiophthora]